MISPTSELRSSSNKADRKIWQRKTTRLASQVSYESSSSDTSSDVEAAAVAATALAIARHVNMGGDSPVEYDPKLRSPSMSSKRWNILPRVGEEKPKLTPHDSVKIKRDGIFQRSSSSLDPSPPTRRERQQRTVSFGSDTEVPASSGLRPTILLPTASGSESKNRERVPWTKPSFGQSKSKRASTTGSSTKSESRRLGDFVSFGHGERTISNDEARKEKKEAKAVSWLETEFDRIDEWYNKDTNAIQEWETRKQKKARVKFERIEKKHEEKKLRAREKMRKEIAKVQNKADRKRAKAETRRQVEQQLARQMSEQISRTGRMPTKYICC